MTGNSSKTVATDTNGLDSKRAVMLPEMRDFLDLMVGGTARFDPNHVDVAAFRAGSESSRARFNIKAPPLAETRDITFETSWGRVEARIFRPTRTGPIPALIYLHGGGWVIGSVKSHERLIAEYASQTGFAVIGLDYVRAPEQKFPAALYQGVACLAQIREAAAELSIDPARIAIGGDSAGANLAVSISLACNEFGIATPAAIVGSYGAYDMSLQLPSHKHHDSDGLMLSHEKMAWFVDQYLSHPSQRMHPLASPILAKLSALPPSYLTVAEIDVIADDSIELAKKARKQGASVVLDMCPGTVHGFVEGVALYDVSAKAIARQCDWLKHVI